MSNISKDQVIHNVKEAYKTVTRDTDTITYGNLPTKILNIQDKVNGWVKPADWPDIDSYTDDVVLLVSDECPIIQFLVATHGATYTGTVDWGDGSATTSFTNADTVCAHDYTNSTSSITLDNGHKAYIIKINARGHYLYRFRIWALNTQASLMPQSWLWLKINTTQLKDCTGMCNGYKSSIHNVRTIPQTLEYADLKACSKITTLQYAFMYCNNLQEVKLPDELANCTTAYMAFYGCQNLKKIIVPKMDSCTSLGGMFTNTGRLESIEFKANSYPAVTNTAAMFQNSGAKEVILPIFPNNTTVSTMFSNWQGQTLIATGDILSQTNAIAAAITSFCYGNTMAKKIDLSAMTIPDSVTTYSTSFGGWGSIETLVLPQGGKKMGGTIASSAYLIPASYKIRSFTIPSTWFSEATTTLNAGIIFYGYNFEEINMDCGLNVSKIVCNGQSTTYKGALNSVILPNTKSTYTGASPQISLNYQNLNSTAITNLINKLPTLSGKTLSLVGCTAAPTQADIAAATAKGWSITV